MPRYPREYGCFTFLSFVGMGIIFLVGLFTDPLGLFKSIGFMILCGGGFLAIIALSIFFPRFWVKEPKVTPKKEINSTITNLDIVVEKEPIKQHLIDRFAGIYMIETKHMISGPVTYRQSTTSSRYIEVLILEDSGKSRRFCLGDLIHDHTKVYNGIIRGAAWYPRPNMIPVESITKELTRTWIASENGISIGDKTYQLKNGILTNFSPNPVYVIDDDLHLQKIENGPQKEWINISLETTYDLKFRRKVLRKFKLKNYLDFDCDYGFKINNEYHIFPKVGGYYDDSRYEIIFDADCKLIETIKISAIEYYERTVFNHYLFYQR